MNNLRTIAIAYAISAVCVLAQDKPTSASVPATKEQTKVAGPAPTIPADLQLQFFRAHSNALEAQRAIEQTPQFKAASDARDKENAIVQKLMDTCGPEHQAQMDTQKDKDGTLVCVLKPKEQAKAPAAGPVPPPPTAKNQ